MQTIIQDPGQTRRGFSLLELVIASSVLAVLFGTLALAFTQQANVLGQATDAYTVTVPAYSAFYRICDELQSTTKNPSGVTAAPTYSVSATSITFRPAVGYLPSDHTDYPECQTAGLLSKNGILYASYAKRIVYNAAGKTVRLEYIDTPGVPGGVTSATQAMLTSGLPPAPMRAVGETLTADVASFAFFDGESKLATPSAPSSTAGYIMGIRLEVRRPSAAPVAKGATFSSSLGNVTLTAKVRLAPEALVNSQGKPVVQ